MPGKKKLLYGALGFMGNVNPFIPVALELKKHGVETDFLVDPALTDTLKKHGLNNILTGDPERSKDALKKLAGARVREEQEIAKVQLDRVYFKQKLEIIDEVLNTYDLCVVNGHDNALVLGAHIYKKPSILISLDPFRKRAKINAFFKLFYNPLLIRLTIFLYTKRIFQFLPKIHFLLQPKKEILPVSHLFQSTAKNSVITGAIHDSLYKTSIADPAFSFFIKRTEGMKKVLIAFGSYTDSLPDGFVDMLIDSVTDCGFCAILISERDRPANELVFHCKKLIDLDEVLPHADFVVHHCGHGTFMRTILFEKPSVLIPLFGVQNELAVRFYKEGLAPEPLNKRVSGYRFRNALVETVKNAELYSVRLKKARERILHEDGVKEITEMILKELNEK